MATEQQTPTKPGTRFCARHGSQFTALKPCPGCRVDPGPRLTATPDVADDVQDAATEAAARVEAAALADDVDRLRRHRKEQKDVDSMGTNAISKLSETRLKWERFADEVHVRRTQKAEDRKLMDDYAAISGTRKAH